MSNSRTEHQPPGPARVTEVSENIYAYIQPDGSWWINNTGFLVGRRGVVSVDACSTERRTRDYLGTIAGLTDQPVRTLINTHHHGDHTFGNYLFAGATIVAHDRARQAMLDWGQPRSAPIWTDVDWGHIELEPPFLTYEDEVRVYIDEMPCHVRYLGTPAHTTNDSVVWVPERRLLFSGDVLFNGGTPFLLQGSLSGALLALQAIRDLEPVTIVPGHGEVCGVEVVDQVESYLRFVQALALDGHKAKLSPLEVARGTDLGEFSDWLDSERIVGNLHRAYAELDGHEPGASLDFAAALNDMVAYNGGQPLTCYA